MRNLHSATFLTAYRKLIAAVGANANRGWLILNAYRAYRAMTRSLDPALALDINLCYALIKLAGAPQAPETAEVSLYHCGECNRHYLVATGKELATQACPLCKMAANHRRLHAQIEEIRQRRA